MEFRKRYVYNPKVDLLGKGGFSRVFKANDVLLEREVALKVFNPEQSAQYDLITEIKKVIKFQQENLCRYYDVAILETVNAFGEEEQVQVGVMEYLDGGELKSYLKKNPQYMNKLLCDVLKGLSYLHKRNIIHRDLKPQNILIKIEDDEPIAKITDFGISKAMGTSQENASALVGTVEYMAPEQFNPAKYGINGQISTHIDLWSFGIMVYDLIIGENLFGSRSKGTGAEIVMSNILNEEYAHKLTSLPAPYQEVVSLCLKKMASERAQSADVLLKVLSGNVTDSSLFTGLRGNQAATISDDETTLIPGNIEGYLGANDDSETQIIDYPNTDSVSFDETMLIKPTEVEKVSGNIFGTSFDLPSTPKEEQDDDATQLIDLSQMNLLTGNEAPKTKPTSPAEDKKAASVEKPKDAPVREEAKLPETQKPSPAAVVPPKREVEKPTKKVEPSPAQKASEKKYMSSEPNQPQDSGSGKPGESLYKNSYDEYLARNPNKPYTLNDSLASRANQRETASEPARAQRPTAAPPKNKPKSNSGLAIAVVIIVVLLLGGLYVFLNKDKWLTQTAQAPVVDSVGTAPKAEDPKKVTGSATPSKVVSGMAIGSSVYSGKTKNGVPDGKGEQKFENGDIYTGGFSKGLFSGRGTLTSSSGEKYVGNWARGKKTSGTLYYTDGTLYRGTFKGDLKDGEGKFMFKDATYYEGEFKNDQFNGRGKIYTASGELTKSGTFKDGVMIGD